MRQEIDGAVGEWIRLREHIPPLVVPWSSSSICRSKKTWVTSGGRVYGRRVFKEMDATNLPEERRLHELQARRLDGV
jgi:hypothetical protein